MADPTTDSSPADPHVPAPELAELQLVGPALAGVFRRIAAGVYDLLPLIALWMIGTALLMPLTRGGIAPTEARQATLS